ncbi:hypothetical protein Zm00014a_034631 [Zea mays]|jgi:hypothetical protein|uniref:Zinc finger (C2H2 type) family protein n=2 Tax=Zea mays TaxID=4577 RepID=K7VY82_MAIZE|nr:zinc finger (C2H2 type) family protein [Zea mays]PWZ07561.1 hypothetical protein Zm00014a_034631 [Zea mays]|eukprot:XP_008661081.1 uncharacterized protein LOC103640242 [Zea mays]
MATAWVRSLSCRSSYAMTDAAIAPSPAKKPPPPPPLPFPCATAAAADVMDAVAYAQRARRKKMEGQRLAREPRPRPKKKPKPMANDAGAEALSTPSPAPVSSAFLTMAELPEGHSSRRVVELIFASGWGGAGSPELSPSPPPSVEALFRVRSAPRAVARFEEARAAAARARGAAARCGADGNEMMRFQCRAPGPGGVFGAGVATCRLGASASAVRTFACSGAAHASAAAAAAAVGRRAMLVCRVIAGRVCPANYPRHGQGQSSAAAAYDSVDMGDGELVVLDSRAVLPCFLIIYKV